MENSSTFSTWGTRKKAEIENVHWIGGNGKKGRGYLVLGVLSWRSYPCEDGRLEDGRREVRAGDKGE